MTSQWSALADKVLAGGAVTRGEAGAVLRAPKDDLLALLDAAFRIRRAHCSVGRVRRKHSRPRLRGRVVSQSPHRGSVRRRGYPVRLLVGRL